MAEVRRRKGEEEREADFEKDYQAEMEHLEHQSQNSAADSTDDHVSEFFLIFKLISCLSLILYHRFYN